MLFENLNCPNCGAPIVGDRCEYCGTVFKFVKHPTTHTYVYPQTEIQKKNEEYKAIILKILEEHTGVKVVSKFLWFKEERLYTLSVREIQEYLPYLTNQKICALLLTLEKNGLIKKTVDKRKAMWYI